MEFEKALQVNPMRCTHPRHRCSGKHETGAKRQLPGVSNPGAGLRWRGDLSASPLFPRGRAEGSAARAVICGCAAVARVRAANPLARLQAGSGRLSPPALLAYDDLAVRRGP